MDYFNIPDIYSDKSQIRSDKINIEKIDITDLDLSKLSCDKDNYFDCVNYKLINESCMKKNKIFILIKTNNSGYQIYNYNTHDIFNDFIFFPIKHSISIVLNKEQNKIDESYTQLHELTFYNCIIHNYKYDIKSYDTGFFNGCKNIFIFKKSEKSYYYTFTIYIDLYDDIKHKKYTYDDKIDIIKLHSDKSDKFIFYYKVVKNNNNILLYLVCIKNIITDKDIMIDVFFTDIDSIYQKYEKAIDNVNKFVFDELDDDTIRINISQIKKYIKGSYQPNMIYINKKYK
jgi:hypothetical protein